MEFKIDGSLVFSDQKGDGYIYLYKEQVDHLRAILEGQQISQQEIEHGIEQGQPQTGKD